MRNDALKDTKRELLATKSGSCGKYLVRPSLSPTIVSSEYNRWKEGLDSKRNSRNSQLQHIWND